MSALGLALAAQDVQEITSTAKDRTGLAVTIFHNDVALVRDQRELRLPNGLLHLAITDLAATIRQSSAWLWTGKDDPLITERSFEFNLLSPRKLFRAGLGEQAGIKFGAGEPSIEATILSQPSYALDPLLVLTPQGVTAVCPDQVQFGEVPPGLRTAPTLLHTMTSTGEGQRIELTYLADKFSWKPRYVMTLHPDGRHLDLQAWAEVRNTSDLDLPACTLQLIAGTPNQLPFDEARDNEPPWDRIPPPTAKPLPRMPPSNHAQAVVEVVASAPEFQEASFFEYLLYTLNQPVSLRSNQTKQLSLFQAKDVSVDLGVRIFFEQTSEAVFDNGVVNPWATMKKWFGSEESPSDLSREANSDRDVPHFDTILQLTNDESHGLGRPLPAGSFLCFYTSPAGHNLKIAEDTMEALPSGSKQEVFLPGITGVKAIKRLTAKSRRPSFWFLLPWTRKAAFDLQAEIWIENSRPHSTKVEVRGCLPLNWKISKSSHPYVRKGDFPEIIDFLAEIPPGRTEVIRYEVATPSFTIPPSSLE